MKHLRNCITLMGACSALAAVDPQLELGPTNLVAGADLENQQVEGGAIRHEDWAIHAFGSGRYWDVGLRLDGWMALGDDEARGSDAAEILELRGRLDYLFEIPEMFQIIPHLQTSFYPDLGTGIDEPYWLGVDGWYLLPWRGLEVGGSVDFDLAGNWGWQASLGAREFVQDPAAAWDLAAWQTLTYGTADYHDFLIGTHSGGLTTLDIGARVTLPAPLVDFWTYLQVDSYWWLDDEDRDALRDTWEMVIALGFEYRPSW